MAAHFGIAIIFWTIWPIDYDLNHFNIASLGLVVNLYLPGVVAALYTYVQPGTSRTRHLKLQIGALLWNFVVGVSDEAVNRHFNGHLFLKDSPWPLPDLSMFRWWMTFDIALPLLGVVAFWCWDWRRLKKQTGRLPPLVSDQEFCSRADDAQQNQEIPSERKDGG